MKDASKLLTSSLNFDSLRALQSNLPDHYAILGLDRNCTAEEIRAAYRILAKQHHPDMNGGCEQAQARTQQLNAAYEVLSDPQQRQAYEEACNVSRPRRSTDRPAKAKRNVSQDVHLRIEDFLRGTTLDVRVNDPSNTEGPESYTLIVPPETTPGTRFRVPREEGGLVTVRVRAHPNSRFKVRGSDLRCDLRISTRCASQGGSETVQGIKGRLRIEIPRGVSRGEILRIAGEGLPKARGGRGDLLVRITYRLDVRIGRASQR